MGESTITIKDMEVIKRIRGELDIKITEWEVENIKWHSGASKASADSGTSGLCERWYDLTRRRDNILLDARRIRKLFSSRFNNCVITLCLDDVVKLSEILG